MFAAHVNARGGLRLGKGGVGYVKVDLTEVRGDDDTQDYIGLYRKLCHDNSVNFLLAPLERQKSVTVLMEFDCSSKVYLAAYPFDKLEAINMDPKGFSVYGVEQTQWGKDTIDLLSGLGAESFAIAGKSADDSDDADDYGHRSVSATRAALRSAIHNSSRTCYDNGLEATGNDPLLLEDVDDLIQKNPDVFIGLGDTDTFTTLLKHFKKKQYAPKAAFFIQGLAATGGLIQESYIQENCKDCVVYDQWMGTVPWAAGMPYAGRKDWSALPDPYGDSMPGGLVRGVDRRWTRYAGSAAEFARIAGIRLGRAPTYYHAKAAATLLMLQLAIELASDEVGVEGGGGMNAGLLQDGNLMKQALHKVDQETFFGKIDISQAVWNVGFELGFAQFQANENTPRLIDTPSFHFGSSPIYPAEWPCELTTSSTPEQYQCCTLSRWLNYVMFAVLLFCTCTCIGLVIVCDSQTCLATRARVWPPQWAGLLRCFCPRGFCCSDWQKPEPGAPDSSWLRNQELEQYLLGDASSSSSQSNTGRCCVYLMLVLHAVVLAAYTAAIYNNSIGGTDPMAIPLPLLVGVVVPACFGLYCDTRIARIRPTVPGKAIKPVVVSLILTPIALWIPYYVARMDVEVVSRFWVLGFLLPLLVLSGGSAWACRCARAELEQSLIGDPQDSASEPGMLANDETLPETTSSRRLNLSSAGRQVIPFSEIKQIQAIASGAYGTVYSGHWSSGGMAVALKTAKRSATTGLYSSVRDPGSGGTNSGGAGNGFAQEIQFNEGAAHRNIVQCFGVTNGIFPPASRPQDALVMEFVPTTLYQRIHQDVRMTTEVRRIVAAGIVAGMIFLHEHKKVAHLDLKSHNILMDQDRAKIADFGLTLETAESLRSSTEVWTKGGSRSEGRESVAAESVPMDHQSRGTGAWMAPEIVTREVEVTTKADVYSFGVVLWEIVSPGQDLFAAWETAAFGKDHGIRNAGIVPKWAANGVRPAIPAAVRAQEKDWADVIEECWQTDPDKRPSFPKLLKKDVFRDSGAGETSEALVSPRPAAAVLEPEPAREPEPEPQAVLGPQWDVYASETKVTRWLKEQGLGRIAANASAHEDYCDMESYEDLAQDSQAKDLFCRMMGMTDVEQLAFVAALEKLDGPVQLFALRPASPGGAGASAAAADGLGDSRPASPSPIPTFGGLE